MYLFIIFYSHVFTVNFPTRYLSEKYIPISYKKRGFKSFDLNHLKNTSIFTLMEIKQPTSNSFIDLQDQLNIFRAASFIPYT